MILENEVKIGGEISVNDFTKSIENLVSTAQDET